VIFSLDGLGLLGFEAAINRDYPVMFGTLYVFTLLGLLLKLIGDLTYVLVDPRIDFEGREAEGRPRRRFADQARPAPLAQLPRQPPRLVVAVDLPLFLLFVLSLFAELVANDRPLLVRYDGRFYAPVLQGLSGDRVRRRSSRPRPTTATPTCRS
jgi:hypothetical protein